jgi:hypothetical protein
MQEGTALSIPQGGIAPNVGKPPLATIDGFSTGPGLGPDGILAGLLKHSPPLQLPDGQTRPQPPQLFPSPKVSVQPSGHGVLLIPGQPQLPIWQVVGYGQMTPQSPQFPLSLNVSVQIPLQFCSKALQDEGSVTFADTWLRAHEAVPRIAPKTIEIMFRRLVDRTPTCLA